MEAAFQLPSLERERERDHGNGEMQGFAGDGPVEPGFTTSLGTDGDGDDSGASSLHSVSWDRQSSLASSSFSSATEVDYRDWHPQSELEEIPSSRWLSPPPTPRLASSEVDWEELLHRDPLSLDMVS
ncbi:hypothetical protein Taro_007613 [Colocasia esculenta]|uniref:Uncharacterized protein n=1 Tax=Colocasia esculenta TaxID=4460 RepID=A0A843TVX2_COLES|nr:hypothetical protein [Colocasia esculenta]